MNTPDIFALGGRHETQDTELIEAGQSWAKLIVKWRGQLSVDDREELDEELGEVMDFINDATPESVIGCMMKLAVVGTWKTRPGDAWYDSNVASLRQVIAFLKSEIGEAA
jgi:hypothetical protein